MNDDYIDAEPNPEYLIKSIAEQGYSLETALADLIDNSITAKAQSIEILTELIEDKLTLFISDNGVGMTKKELSDNMQFPSKSMEAKREKSDLGRFGLGMKTASFSQTRKFTVLSKKEGGEYEGRTWDVNYLKSSGKWRVLINKKTEIDNLIREYKKISLNRLGQFINYEPNTLIIWSGLYKFNISSDSESTIDLLNKQLTEITLEYLGIVFHKFLEKSLKPIKIKINNSLVSPFNPFPNSKSSELRSLGERQNILRENILKMEGFILPVSSTNPDSEKDWRTKNMGLLDLEGIYIYRGDRIISFGGWAGLIKKEPKLKLARLRIEINNANDDLFQLKVDKSGIIVPHELRLAVIRYIIELKNEARNELSKRGVRMNSSFKGKNHTDLFNRIPSSNGTLLDINKDYPILKNITNELNPKQNRMLSLLLKVVTAKLNYNKDVIDNRNTIEDNTENGFTNDEIIEAIIDFKNKGWPKEKILNAFLKDLGYSMNNLPEKINNVLYKK
jgi:hypothetical protein